MTELVGDDELLYRRAVARWEPRTYSQDINGSWVVAASAYISRSDISVDRAILSPFGPVSSQSSIDDGVIELLTGEIRAISVSTNDRDGRPVETHAADVVADPLPENDAHALIVALPPIVQSGAQRRLRDALARISSWAILPIEIRPA